MDLTGDDFKQLAKQIAASGGALSPTLKERLTVLLAALEKPETDPQATLDYRQQVLKDPHADPDSKKTARRIIAKWDSEEVGVRTETANLRRALRNRIWSLTGDRGCVLDVPVRRGQPYRVEAHVPAGKERLWQPHFSSSKDLDVVIYERLFWRHGSNTYIRSTMVNHEDERSNLFGDLPEGITSLPQWDAFLGGLRASRHYVSSGELSSALLLSDFLNDSFREFLRRTVRVRIHQQGATSGNDVIIAATRVGDPDVFQDTDERFSAKDNGIEPGYPDEAEAPPYRTVHVLVSRREHNGCPRTLLQGSHGRALEGVCSLLLASPAATENLVQAMDLGEKRIPRQFQIVFRVRLVYDPRQQQNKAIRATPVAWADARNAKEMRTLEAGFEL
jgi:hypothetical protein